MTILQYDVIIDTSRVGDELEKLTNKFDVAFSKITAESIKLAKKVSEKISNIEIQSSEKSAVERIAIEKTFWESKLALARSYSARVNNVTNDYDRKIKASGSAIASGIIGGNEEYKQTGGVGIGGIAAAEIISGSVLRKNIGSDTRNIISEGISSKIDLAKNITRKQAVDKASSLLQEIASGKKEEDKNLTKEELDIKRKKAVDKSSSLLQEIASGKKEIASQELNKRITPVIQEKTQAAMQKLLPPETESRKAHLTRIEASKKEYENAKDKLSQAKLDKQIFVQSDSHRAKLGALEKESYKKQLETHDSNIRAADIELKTAKTKHTQANRNFQKPAEKKPSGVGLRSFGAGLLRSAGYGAAIGSVYMVGSSILSNVSDELKNSISDMQLANKAFQTIPVQNRGTTIEQQRTQIRDLKGTAKKTRQSVVSETGLTNDQASNLLQGYQESGGKLLPMEQAIRLGSATQAFGLDPTVVGSTTGLISLALRDQGKVTGNQKSEEDIAKQAEDIFLKLSKSGNIGTIDISHLGRADWGQLLSVVQKVSPAQDPLQQLAPIFEAMQLSKLSASEAVTGIENFYNDMLQPGNMKDLKKAGINPFNDKGEYKAINDIFTEIMEKVGTDPRNIAKFQGIRGQRILSGQTQVWKQLQDEEKKKLEKSSGKKQVNEETLTKNTSKRYKKYLEENKIVLDTKEIEAILAETMEDPAIKLAKAQEQLGQNIANLASKAIPTLTYALDFLASVFMNEKSYQAYSKENISNKEESRIIRDKITSGVFNKYDAEKRLIDQDERLKFLDESYKSLGLDPITGEETQTGKKIKTDIRKTEEAREFWRKYTEESPQDAIEYGLNLKDNPELVDFTNFAVKNTPEGKIYNIEKNINRMEKQNEYLSPLNAENESGKLEEQKTKLYKQLEENKNYAPRKKVIENEINQIEILQRRISRRTNTEKTSGKQTDVDLSEPISETNSPVKPVNSEELKTKQRTLTKNETELNEVNNKLYQLTLDEDFGKLPQKEERDRLEARKVELEQVVKTQKEEIRTSYPETKEETKKEETKKDLQERMQIAKDKIDGIGFDLPETEREKEDAQQEYDYYKSELEKIEQPQVKEQQSEELKIESATITNATADTITLSDAGWSAFTNSLVTSINQALSGLKPPGKGGKGGQNPPENPSLD